MDGVLDGVIDDVIDGMDGVACGAAKHAYNPWGECCEPYHTGRR